MTELLPLKITQKLDAFIQERLDRGMEVVSIRIKDHRIQELYPADWPARRIAASLRCYMNRREKKWQIDHRENTHQYYVSKIPECQRSIWDFEGESAAC